jgi:hypothetical protein
MAIAPGSRKENDQTCDSALRKWRKVFDLPILLFSICDTIFTIISGMIHFQLAITANDRDVDRAHAAALELRQLLTDETDAVVRLPIAQGREQRGSHHNRHNSRHILNQWGRHLGVQSA